MLQVKCSMLLVVNAAEQHYGEQQLHRDCVQGTVSLSWQRPQKLQVPCFMSLLCCPAASLKARHTGTGSLSLPGGCLLLHVHCC